MQRFLLLSVVALIGVSHAVNLSDAVAESERWKRIRHVAVEAIPRINAEGLVAKRTLLECIATVSEPDAAEVSSLGDDSSDVLQMVVCLCFDTPDSVHCRCFGRRGNFDEAALVL